MADDDDDDQGKGWKPHDEESRTTQAQGRMTPTSGGIGNPATKILQPPYRREGRRQGRGQPQPTEGLETPKPDRKEERRRRQRRRPQPTEVLGTP
jgi:hypothetical protein